MAGERGLEVETELVSVEETLGRHDVKARLAAKIVEKRFGWRPRRVARLLVLPDDSTPRRQVYASRPPAAERPGRLVFVDACGSRRPA